MVGQEDRSLLIERKDTRGPLIVVGGFAAILFWWVGLTAYISAGYIDAGSFGSGVVGFLVFLLVPTLVTTATYLAIRRQRRPAREAGKGRHRSN